jgi:pimeloyl-ACP methyl ester carboxylesterase
VSDAPVALHVEIAGDGPAIVLAHGFGGSARNFRATARALRARWRVVLFDARGHARSEAPRDPAAYGPEAFVADLGRVLDAAGAERAVVGGLSMGAATALAFALTHRERVRGLVLAAYPGAGGVASVAERFADAIERRGLEAAGAEFVWGPRSGLGEAGARLVRRGFLEHAPHALAATLRGALARQPALEALAPALARLDVPALVIVGARDAPSVTASRALVAALPRARLVEVPDAGHVVNLEQRRAFNAALEEFLAALPAPSAGRSS